MPYIKELVKERWIVYSDIGNYTGLLIKNNKDFDMLVLPNRNHGYAREEYVARRTWDYFVMHLMGSTPPKEYKIERKN